MPLPGDAAPATVAQISASPTTTTLTSSPSASPRPTEGRQAQRRRSLDLVAEAHGDVDAFVRELDLKRRQLDDQIHRFISQKEREFKLYERDLRTRYRTASSISSSTTAPSQTLTAESPLSVDSPSSEVPASAPSDQAQLTNGPKHEREAELLGLFTPAFLPLIDGHPAPIERSPSAPPSTAHAVASIVTPERQTLNRARTEPLIHAPDTPVSRAALGARTPSSGSETGKNLVSALKSPASKPRLPREKRVSLFVDDAVVAPSDNIPSQADHDENSQPPSDLTANNNQGHQDTQFTKNLLKAQASLNTSVPKPTNPSPPTSPPVPKQPGGLSLGLASATTPSTITTGPVQTSVQPPRDEELGSPFTMDEEFEHPRRSSVDATYIEDIDIDTDSAPESESTLHATSPNSLGSSRTSPPVQQPSTLDIPTRIRSSSSSSAQPTEPGFSRPSVQEDPQFEFSDQTPVETPAQGSFYDSFSRPSYTKQPVVGSLGESFMQRNAEEMMRRRQSVQRS